MLFLIIKTHNFWQFITKELHTLWAASFQLNNCYNDHSKMIHNAGAVIIPSNLLTSTGVVEYPIIIIIIRGKINFSIDFFVCFSQRDYMSSYSSSSRIRMPMSYITFLLVFLIFIYKSFQQGQNRSAKKTSLRGKSDLYFHNG